jgi:hypothetical protein
MVELSGRPFLSFCLVKDGFSLGKLRKSSAPITAVRQAMRELRRQAGDYTALTMLRGQNPTSVHQGFFFFLSLNSNSLFQDLTHLRGGLKTADI